MGVDTNGDIYFFSGTTDGNPPMMNADPKLGLVTTNYVRIPTKMPIHDLHDQEDQFDIDVNGFEVMNYDGKVHNRFDKNSDEQKCLYEETANILTNRLGASRVIVFMHVIRSRGPFRPGDECDQYNKNPVFYPHVDNDPISARFKVEEVVGKEEAMKILKNRFQIINTWRPLGSNPIINIPLSICDYQTIDTKNDIHLSDTQGSANTTSVYNISKSINSQQKWYYLRNMKSNEMLVFKIFDSNPSVARFGAHTAFIDENAPKNNVEQSSIEMRCLVVYDQ